MNILGCMKIKRNKYFRLKNMKMNKYFKVNEYEDEWIF